MKERALISCINRWFCDYSRAFLRKLFGIQNINKNVLEVDLLFDIGCCFDRSLSIAPLSFLAPTVPSKGGLSDDGVNDESFWARREGLVSFLCEYWGTTCVRGKRLGFRLEPGTGGNIIWGDEGIMAGEPGVKFGGMGGMKESKSMEKWPKLRWGVKWEITIKEISKFL